VVDQQQHILLLKRRNEPAKGLWWVPGGRVHMGETRIAAAVRKLREECGLDVRHSAPNEISTEDLILPNGQGGSMHVIATVFRIEVSTEVQIVLDAQSEAAAWRLAESWRAEGLHPYVQKIMSRLG